MKSLKNIILSVFLAGFVFITPLKTDALTIEEIIKNANGLQPINITNIKNAVSIYDYRENVEEINSILDVSLNNSKKANDKLIELNTLMNSINEDNKALLIIKDKKEYDNSLTILKEKVELAKQTNDIAKNYSQTGLDKYNDALVKYASLKTKLENEKEVIDDMLDFNIGKVNIKLNSINDLLEELANTENKLKKAYDEANIAYENAKANANVANNNFSEKLEELKEYVEVNGEQELNDLIQVNTKYLTSGVLYATSQVALKLIDVEIQLVEAEINGLEADLALLNEQLAPYEETLNNKKNELSNLNGELDILNETLNNNGTVIELESKISSANEVLQDLNNTKNNIEVAKTKCSNYVVDLNAAIENNDTAKVVELLLKNEETYGFAEKNIKVTIEKKLNSSFELINYVFVTDLDNSKEFVYSYEQNDDVVTIYEQNKVSEHEVTELTGSFTAGKYLAYLDDKAIAVISVGSTSGFYKSSKLYSLNYDNGWKATTTTNECETYKDTFFGSICTSYKKVSYDVVVTVAEHYVQGSSKPITSQAAINRCNALETNTIDTEISLQQEKINGLNNKLNLATTLENQIVSKKAEITAKESEVAAAQAEIDNLKATITNESELTYVEIEAKLVKLDEKLNHYPKFGDENFVNDLANIADLTSLITNLTQGNIDVQAIIETINNLNVGLNIKKKFINEIDTILADNYNKSKQDLIDIAGEDLENISNILNAIAPLIKEAAEGNLKLLEEKTKFKIAKANYESLLNVKEMVLDAQEQVLDELETLEKLKDENNFDLSDLDEKFKKTEEALISTNIEVEVKINDYVEKVEKPDITEKEENNEIENNSSVEKPDATENEENNEIENNSSVEKLDTIQNEQNNDIENNLSVEKLDSTSKKENNINNIVGNKEIIEDNNAISKKEITENNNTIKKEEGFSWKILLWLLPISLILFFIIIFIKRKKDKA